MYNTCKAYTSLLLLLFFSLVLCLIINYQIINPVEIMIFIPLFDKFIYPSIERRTGHPISHLSRMGWGMFLCAVSFFVSGLLESYIVSQEQQDREGRGGQEEEGQQAIVSIFWQLPQITILAVAEILLSVTGYDFCYTNSSNGCKAIILALYLVTTAVGDFFAGILYDGIFHNWDRCTVMHTCGVLMLLNLLVFRSVAKWWNNCQTEKSIINNNKSKTNNGVLLVEMTGIVADTKLN